MLPKIVLPSCVAKVISRYGQTGEPKKLATTFSLGFCMLVVWGCGLFPQDHLQGWVGFHREELIRVMGPPSKETPLPDGGTRLEFIERITRHPTAAQVYGASYVCHKIFDLDSDGFIQDVSEEGC